MPRRRSIAHELAVAEVRLFPAAPGRDQVAPSEPGAPRITTGDVQSGLYACTQAEARPATCLLDSSFPSVRSDSTRPGRESSWPSLVLRRMAALRPGAERPADVRAIGGAGKLRPRYADGARPECRHAVRVRQANLPPARSVSAKEQGRAVGVLPAREIPVAVAGAAERTEQVALRGAFTVLVARAWLAGQPGRSGACATPAGRRHRPAIRVAAAGDDACAAVGARRVAGRRTIGGAGPPANAVAARLAGGAADAAAATVAGVGCRVDAGASTAVRVSRRAIARRAALIARDALAGAGLLAAGASPRAPAVGADLIGVARSALAPAPITPADLAVAVGNADRRCAGVLARTRATGRAGGMAPDELPSIRFPDGLRLTARGIAQTNVDALFAAPRGRRPRSVEHSKVGNGAGGESVQERCPAHRRRRQGFAEGIEAGTVHEAHLTLTPTHLVRSCAAVCAGSVRNTSIESRISGCPDPSPGSGCVQAGRALRSMCPPLPQKSAS